MLSSSSQFETEKPGKYLMQLCKHFAHKVEVTYNEEIGEVNFPCGTARLQNKTNRLEFHVEAPSEEELKMCQSIIENHIVRFAFRENLEKLNWQTAPS